MVNKLFLKLIFKINKLIIYIIVIFNNLCNYSFFLFFKKIIFIILNTININYYISIMYIYIHK
ncbi:hypothetical protein BCR32DRAFT_63084 [Anaeromyces robustus]|uniref:Uncharacterized protein n=1 Tax=Anaeromyces robustus TaxID=1754192 RepID=A0A1Y1WUL4_9FUNG|nr:hypothetical protein BCR32DRAFT_63084 [Anaeromyces robustus]|eukprot:ORX77237.1 hypothetical protein BCR32DRAFT_63084 [Anaeromyces robustus]